MAITPPEYPTGPPISGSEKKGVRGGPPFRDRFLDQREDEPVHDLVVDRLAGLQRQAQVGAGLLGGGGTGPFTATGELEGGRGVARRRAVAAVRRPVFAECGAGCLEFERDSGDQYRAPLTEW